MGELGSLQGRTRFAGYLAGGVLAVGMTVSIAGGAAAAL